MALIDEDDEDGLRELPTRVRKLTDHQRLVCQHAVDTLNDMLDVRALKLFLVCYLAPHLLKLVVLTGC